VLCAVDASARAPAVIRTAAEIAERFAAELHVFRAITLEPELPPAAATEPDHLEDVLVRRATADLERLAAAHPHAHVMPPAVTSGAPWRAILQAAARIRADLVVLGSHGYGGLDHLLGTTAGQVANRAPHNVLIVHDR
jgi:nucleotide-binding universal stress UspA family protein